MKPMSLIVGTRSLAIILGATLTLAIAGCGDSPKRDVKDKVDVTQTVHKHDKPGEVCYICDSSLRDSGRLWCKAHGRYEDRCWLCHSELHDKNRLYCQEHFLYEDECFICRPELHDTPKKKPDRPGADASQAKPTLFCEEHDVAEHECGICQPQLAAKLGVGQSMKVRFVSNQSILKAGIQTALPTSISSSPVIEAFCQVGYNANAFAHITPLASGVIRRVTIDVGAEVKEGDALLEINSAEIAEAKAAYLAAIADHRVKEITCKREEKLVKERISATREYEEAKAYCDIALLTQNTARQKLFNYGFSETEIKKIKETQDSSSLYTVRAPFGGTVVARKAVLGEAVEPGQTLFALADLTTLWLELSIPAYRTAFIEKELDVEAAFDSLPGISVKGKLTWVATSIDERSRMLKARAVVPNERRVLKSGMFGKAQITIKSIAKNLRVPKSAVQRFLGNPHLFVKEDDDLYALRRIVLGNKTDVGIDVIAGIQENDQIVVVGTFTVMSEFLKSRLGAGCVDE